MDITQEQMELLRDIVDAYWTPDESGRKHDFMIYTAGGGAGTTIQHAALPGGPRTVEKGERSVDAPDLDELEANQFIRLEGTSRSGSMHPTTLGQQAVREHRQLEHIARTGSGDMAASASGSGVGWRDTLPVLEAVVELYPQAPPGFGVSQMRVNQRLGREEEDLRTSRAFEMLDGTYIEGRMKTDQVPGPLMAIPTERALQLLAGWPGDGVVAFERLISALESQIAAATDEVERSKLRAVLDAVRGVGEGIVAEILTRVIFDRGNI
jgi:hypothetical protein